MMVFVQAPAFDLDPKGAISLVVQYAITDMSGKLVNVSGNVLTYLTLALTEADTSATIKKRIETVILRTELSLTSPKFTYLF